ncbi:HepT-like ribonuclease domain-containing protein [Flavobacterium ichthyis]|nr:HepT-like ribonuclease domain-containing protein [Flavobacterium ichthyis]
MTEKSIKYLYDVLMAIDLIEEFTLNIGFETYNSDRKTQSAVERQLAIVG